MIDTAVQTLTNRELQVRKEAATPRGIGITYDFYAARAENAEIWDIEGRRFIDFAGGIAVSNVGHRNPKVVKAVGEQLACFIHTCYQVVPYASYIRLAERINAITPGSYPKKTAFFSTGAEALENAVKIARVATGRPAMIAFVGGFHGRTMMTMALTGKMAPYKFGFGPLPAEVFHAPFPNLLHGITVEHSLQAIEGLFKADIDPKRVAAIIVEPVQGEGGFYVAPQPFMTALRALCDEHQILLVADEVQTGFGRTGKMFAMEHYGVLPDLLTFGKSVANGIPLTGVCGRAEIMDAPLPGSLGGTYAGNQLALAAANAVLDVFEEDGLLARANVLGDRLRSKLQSLRDAVPQIAEIRGLGAMIAVEFCQSGSKRPYPDFAKQVQKKACDRGLLLLTCGIYSNVIRFLFPLSISDQLMEEALNILAFALIESAAVVQP